MSVNDVIRSLRLGHTQGESKESANDMSVLIKQSVKDAKIAAIRSTLRELYLDEIKARLAEDDYTLFGDQADEVKRLVAISEQHQRTSSSSRNSTAALVTINPPPTLDIYDFRDHVESLISKLQAMGLTGAYFFEARAPEPPYGAHVHIALNFEEITPPPELRKNLLQKCMGKKLSIFAKRPSHDQLNVKFSTHITGYKNFLSYATNSKKIVDGEDKSTSLRKVLNVQNIIEF